MKVSVEKQRLLVKKRETKARLQAQDVKIDLTKLEEEEVDVKNRAGTEEEWLNSSTKSPFCQIFDVVCQQMVGACRERERVIICGQSTKVFLQAKFCKRYRQESDVYCSSLVCNYAE